METIREILHLLAKLEKLQDSDLNIASIEFFSDGSGQVKVLGVGAIKYFRNTQEAVNYLRGG